MRKLDPLPWFKSFFLLIFLLLAALDAPAAGAPPNSPGLSQGPFENLSGSLDPQLAVGLRWIVAIDGGNFYFYRRAADGSIDPTNPFVFSADDVFGNLIDGMNNTLQFPWWYPLHCNRDDQSACVNEFYDARVFYDSARDRFWLAAAARNKVWKCDSDGDGEIDGYQLPTPPGGTAVCNPGAPDMAHRFIVVAATGKTPPIIGGSADPENPQAFYNWTLVDDYADWPQIMVHDKYLLLNHRDLEFGGLRLYAFDADKLAGGFKDGTTLEVTPWTFNAFNFNTIAFDWDSKVGIFAQLDTPQYFVSTHGATNGVTYLVAGDHKYLIIYGLIQNPDDPDGKPLLLIPAAVNIHHTVQWANNFAVFRKNRISLAWSDCISLCQFRSFLRTVRVPVHRSYNFPSTIWASNKTNYGYVNATIGNSATNFNAYAVPGIEVNSNDDLVIVFNRYRLLFPTGKSSDFPQARYSILYHGQTSFSPTRLLHVGSGWPLNTNVSPPSLLLPGGGGVIDLVGLAVDPLDTRQVWMSHDYGTPPGDSNYVEVVGAVRP